MPDPTQTVSSNGTSMTTVPPAAPAVQVTEPKDDLISRVSSHKPNEPVQSDDKFDFGKYQEHLQKLDPASRKLVEDAYKSMQADYTKKTQDIASKSQEVSSLKQALEQSKQYTPARIQELLNDPTFIQAAKEYEAMRAPSSQSTPSGELTKEEFDYLPPEQQKVYLQQQQANQLLKTLQGELNTIKTQKEDAELSTRYKNYDPAKINQLYMDFTTGKVQATREHLHKVVDYDDAVNRAYLLGRQDERSGILEKSNASTVTGGLTTATQRTVPERQKGESFTDYWKRCAQEAKASLGKT